MNNEEKIISMLETLVLKVDQLEGGQARLEDAVGKVLTEQARQSVDISLIRGAVAAIEQSQSKKIQAILEYESAYEAELGDLRHRLRYLEEARAI